MVSATDWNSIPPYLKAVTVLIPEGNVAAEAIAAISGFPLSTEHDSAVTTISKNENVDPPGIVKRKRTLVGMLENDDYKWRNIGTLANAIRLSPEETRDLLVEIDARASIKAGGPEVWGLVSRVGPA
jgi:hypothetical protein